MRSSLLGSLLQVLKFNLDRKASRVRVFELGRVFLRDTSVPGSDTTVEGFNQPMRVAGLAYGPLDALQWGLREQGVDFYDIKGDVQALLAPRVASFTAAEHPAMHPGRCARVVLAGQDIGFIGELHPRWRQSYGLAQAPVLFELDLAAVLARAVPVFSAVAKHQSVARDIGVIVQEHVTLADVLRAVAAVPIADMWHSTVLFDVYRPKLTDLAKDGEAAGALCPGEKCLLLRLTLNSDTGLSEAQIDAAVAAILARLAADTGARLRA